MWLSFLQKPQEEEEQSGSRGWRQGVTEIPQVTGLDLESCMHRVPMGADTNQIYTVGSWRSGQWSQLLNLWKHDVKGNRHRNISKNSAAGNTPRHLNTGAPVSPRQQDFRVHFRSWEVSVLALPLAEFQSRLVLPYLLIFTPCPTSPQSLRYKNLLKD